MSESIMIELTYLNHRYVFDETVSNIFGVDGATHIVTFIDSTYHADTMSEIIEGLDFITFYSYDYYIHFDKMRKIFKFGLKKVWNLMRQLYEALPIINFVLWQEKSFLIHAAAIEIEGNAYLLLGESGAGKTTFSNLAYDRNIHILGDEMVAVQFDDIPVIWGTYIHSNDFNFWGENVVSRPFPLIACFILEKSKQSKIRQIPHRSKADLFNKFVRKYIYKIYRIEKLLSLINNFEFYYLEFEKEHFEFDLLASMMEYRSRIYLDRINQMIYRNPSYFSELIRSLEDYHNKKINFVEVIKQKQYYIEIFKEINRIEFKSCFLVGELNDVNLEKLAPILPNICCFISYIQINNLSHIGRKKLFSLSKNIDNKGITINQIQLLKNQNHVNCIKKMLIVGNLDDTPEYEQYIINQLKGITIEMFELHDFWGIFDNGNLVSLARVDKEIFTPDLKVRSIGLVFTKNEYRNKGYASNLILQLLTQYSKETNIWRYEAEENNVPSCNLAYKLGFIYEGDTFYYEYKSQRNPGVRK